MIFYIPDSRLAPRITCRNETVVRAAEAQSERRAICRHQVQLLVRFEIPDDNVARCVVGGVPLHLRIKVPRIPGRRFCPFPDGPQVGQRKTGNSFVAQIQPIAIGRAFPQERQSIEPLPGQSCHVAGPRLVQP